MLNFIYWGLVSQRLYVKFSQKKKKLKFIQPVSKFYTNFPVQSMFNLMQFENYR